jgi:putative transposase
MSRPLRLQFPGAFYHLTSRGNQREAIYLDKYDFQRFVDLLGEVCLRYHWRCHAWCLMTNHYHLVIETPDANLSRGMRQLNGLYTQRFNRRHKRVGHVFQGRYKAILVDADTYLLELVRYVVLNPVRAHVVKSAGQWHWSSYRYMTGHTASPPWLETDRILSQFSAQRAQAQQRFVRFVAEGQQPATFWQNLRQQIYLGDESFVSRMLGLIDNPSQMLEVPIAQRREAARSLQYYAKKFQDRRLAMKEAYASGAYTLKEIADFFGCHYSTVSRVVKWLEMH